MNYSIFSDWMCFFTNIPLTQAFWRRCGNIVEIKIIWNGRYFDTENEALVDARLAAQMDVSAVKPAGLPKADAHNSISEATSVAKLCPFSNKWYGSVCWKNQTDYLEKVK